jgi:hypothetical protein
MLCLAKQVFDDSQEKALRLQEERAMRPGRGNEYFWYVSAAVSLVGMQSHPAQSEKLKRLAGDRVAKLLYKELSLRDDPNDETLATEVSSYWSTPMTMWVDWNRLCSRVMSLVRLFNRP